MNPLKLLVIPMAILALHPAASAERAALVIGNDAYPDVTDADTGQPRQVRLNNCVKDAAAVRDMLRDQLGFAEKNIVFAADVDEAGMLEALEKFKKSAAGAEIALVYYAGHGMESRDGREAYLIPIDADLAGAANSESILRKDGLKLSDVLHELGDTTGGAKVVLLDCCRDRPKARAVAGEGVEGGGLAVLPDDRIPPDTVILLAAAPNRQASDGVDHGPFTKALLEVLPIAGQSMLDAFFAVSDAVQKATGKRQIPWLKFDGSGTVFRQNALVRGPAAAKAEGDTMNANDLARTQKEIADLKALVSKLLANSATQDSHASELAAVRAELAKMQKAAAGSVVPVEPAPSRSTALLDEGEIGKGWTFELGKSQRITLRYVPGGDFVMGSPEDETGHDGNEAQVNVTLSNHFWMAESEVTLGQWEAILGVPVDEEIGAGKPMDNTSWNDAQEFVDKLNSRNLLPAGWRWSLPTEAQWERACRGGTETPFGLPDGNGSDGVDYLSDSMASFNAEEPYGSAEAMTYVGHAVDVKSFAPNAYGLHDMHGSAFEWCLDAWDGVSPLPGGTDPLGTSGEYRAMRGGSWNDRGFECRSAIRGYDKPDAYGSYGVRVVAVRTE